MSECLMCDYAETYIRERDELISELRQEVARARSEGRREALEEAAVSVIKWHGALPMPLRAHALEYAKALAQALRALADEGKDGG